MHKLTTPDGVPIYYLGPELEVGPLPAFVYFALAGDESLHLPPYHQPAEILKAHPLRIFSFTLPGHGEGYDKFTAMSYWAEQMLLGRYLLEVFFEQTAQALTWLVQQQIILPEALAVGGLSRGAFVATHVAARQPLVKTILGFAPLTHLSLLPQFQSLQERAQSLDLLSLIPQLHHVKNFRFYIGNRDTLVGTESCFHFVQQLVEYAYKQHLKQATELMITPSIGHQGHGTAPHIFAEGSAWIQHHLLGQ